MQIGLAVITVGEIGCFFYEHPTFGWPYITQIVLFSWKDNIMWGSPWMKEH